MYSLRAWFIGLAIALLWQDSGWADFQSALKLYQQQDYESAYQQFKALAQRGHIDAQNNLGVLYHSGKGVPQNYAQAAVWYRKAAQRGHPDAQNNLAILYSTGNGVERDPALAHAWFQFAAEQGLEVARRNRDSIVEQWDAERLKRAQEIAQQLRATITDYAKPSATAVPASELKVPLSAESTAQPRVDGHEQYGPVKPGETLWSIATKLKSRQFSTQQMMIALWRANPGAFSEPRIDRLKANVRLMIPLDQEVARVDPQEAKSEVRKQLEQ